jgi:hypothetical protein
MQAKVLTSSLNGVTVVKVRRSSHEGEVIDGRHYDLKPGQTIEVKRVTNNPYLVRVKSI